MGIKNLSTLIKKHAPGAIETVNVADLKNMTIGIDTSIVVYKLFSVGLSRHIVNKNNAQINHIQGIFYRTVKLLMAGIKPVYVLDGAPPDMKSALMAKRRAARMAGKATSLQRGIFVDICEVLRAMGVAQIQAPQEAEAQLAALCKSGVVDAVATDDLDALVFGAECVILGMDANAKCVQIIRRQKVLDLLKLDNAQFMDLCILLGCDYTGTIAGIGMVNALRLIRQFNTIELILTKNNLIADKCDYVGARSVFNGVQVRVGVDLQTAPDLKTLETLLIKTHGLDASRVEKGINVLKKLKC